MEDVGLIGSVGAVTGDGLERAVLVRPCEIASLGVSLELTGTSLCPKEGVTLGAETGEGGSAYGANTKPWGSVDWAGSRGGCSEAPRAETKTGASVKTGEAMLEQDSGGEFI